MSRRGREYAVLARDIGLGREGQVYVSLRLVLRAASADAAVALRAACEAVRQSYTRGGWTASATYTGEALQVNLCAPHAVVIGRAE